MPPPLRYAIMLLPLRLLSPAALIDIFFAAPPPLLIRFAAPMLPLLIFIRHDELYCRFAAFRRMRFFFYFDVAALLFTLYH